MDKLKEQLAVVKEHSFWILCGGILLVSLVSWYMSTNHLQKEQVKYKGDIESALTTLKGVSETTNHPNDSTSKGMEVVMQKFGEDVYQAWARLAENQEQVLVWEGIFGSDDKFLLDVRPLRPIETKVSDKVGDPEIINLDNRTLYRDFIGGEVPKLAEIILAKWQVDAHSLGTGMPGMTGGGETGAGPPGGGGGAMAGPGGMPGMAGMAGGAGAVKDDDPNVVVIWNPNNQKQITQVHFGMATNSDAIPNTLEVLYAQEDLWVFQNLMKIIRATNGDAARKHEAAIKYIEYVQIGRSAGDLTGQVTLRNGNSFGGANSMMPGGGSGMPGGSGMQMGGGAPGAGASGGAGGTAGMMAAGGMGGPGAGGAGGAGGTAPSAGMMPGMGGPGGGAPGVGGKSGAGSTGGATGTTTLGSGRYVDLSYAPIQDITRLRNAMKGATTKPEDMLLAVAKRMPVRMEFKMDQRKLTTLLAECGNSRLPVEVRQVRIKGAASSVGGAGSSPGMGGGGMPGAGGMGMPGAGGMGMPGAGGMGPAGGEGGGAAAFGGGMMPGTASGGGGGARPASGIASSKEDPNEITVEIYGIVYIYNPPERKLLGLPEREGTTPGTVSPGPVTTPASTTPPAAKPAITAGAAAGR